MKSLAGFAIVFIAAVSGCRSVSPVVRSFVEGRVSDVVLRRPTGQAVRLSSLRGSVVVVDVWATWCRPCREGLPAMQRLADRVAGVETPGVEVPGVVFFALSVDEPGVDVERYLADLDVSLPVVSSPPDGEALRVWGVSEVPTTLVLDRTGAVRFKRVGASRDVVPEVAAVLADLGVSAAALAGGPASP